MARIANISSKLSLNTSQFSTAMGRARKMTGEFVGTIGRAGARVAKYGAVMAAAGAATAAYVVKGQLKAIDSSAKFADSIGISTEALAGLRHSANLTGVEQGAFDKSLQKMVLNLAAAADGTGPVAEALDKLGLSAAEVAAMTPDKAFGTIAGAIGKVEGASAKAEVAYRIFGKSGVDLVNTLALGEAGLAANAAEADRLGLSFSRMDAAKVEAANDSIARVQAAITGAGQSLTIGLAPYIDAAAQKLLGMAGDGEGMAKRIMTGIEWVASGIATAADWFGYFRAAFHGVEAAIALGLGVMVKGFALVGRAIEAVVNLMPGVEVTFSDTLSALGDGLIHTAKTAAVAAETAFNDAASGKNSAKVAALFADIRAKADDSAAAVARDAEAKRGAAGITDDMVASLEDEAKARAKVQEVIDGLDKQLARVGMNENQIKLADLAELGATNAELEKAAATLAKIDAIKAADDRAGQIGDMIGEIEKEVRLFGVSDDARKLLDLESLGASDEQIAKAKAAMDKLAALNEQSNAPEVKQADPASLVRVGSAEAQRLAFQAARNNGAAKDDTPKQQLATQSRMARSLETIERRGRDTGGEEWTL